ncbi:MAG: type I methionyl aminopeptidase [Candidatus Nanopelagicales bacterium]|jgi:methionyl aminopeptidase
MFRSRDRIEIKSADQLVSMRAAGLVVAKTLHRVAQMTVPGITTAEMDECAAQSIRDEGATPSFLGYHGFPAHICVSVNEEVVHGIPGSRRIASGDVVSIDCGAIIDGWHGDAAVTVLVGDVSEDLRELSRVTEQSLWAGLAAARPGNRLSDIGHAVESSVRASGEAYGIVEEYVGHGIGSSMHMEPAVPNYGRPGKGPRLVPGMALAVEPMIILGDPTVEVLDDEWTVVTSDGSHASHWEHTVAVTEDGPWVLTALDEVRL